MKVRINFTDFWKNFNKQGNYFWELLSERFELELSDDPEFLIYGPFGDDYLRFNCIKIFYTGENVRPDFSQCDYAFTFDYIDDHRHFRLPLFAVNNFADNLISRPSPDVVLDQKRKFCNFIYSNTNAKERIEFFHALSKYKKVDSGGKVLNNIGYRVGDILEFIGQYKFTISFENASFPGYTTEKIIQPMVMNSIPVYWGNPRVHEDFNQNSFINVHAYSNYEEAIDRIIEIDKNDDLYLEILSQPYFNNGILPPSFNRSVILDRFEAIFLDKEITPVSSTLRNKMNQIIHGSNKSLQKLVKKVKRFS